MTFFIVFLVFVSDKPLAGGSFFSLLLVYHNQKHISMQKEKSLRPTAGRFGMRSAFALRIFSGKNIYNFAILENLRIFQNCLFTGGVVKANGICSAAFCESAALRLASSPSQSPTVTALPKGEPLAVPANFIFLPRPLPLGEVARRKP